MMKIVCPLNPMPNGTCRTIKAQCQQVSIANLVRETGGYAATGVIEIIYETESLPPLSK